MTGTARNTITSKRTMLAKGAKFRSPFCQREISTTKNLTKCEKELGIYAMYKDTRDWKEVLFGFKDTEVNRFNMLSMRTGSPIANDIVNAWAIILNDRENFRSDLSPLRFFASTNLYMDCIEANGISYDNQRSTFFILMTMEIQEYHQNKINLIDMYFFPVYRKGLYYAVCVDLRKGRVFVLDSALDITANEENDIYEEVCNTFKKLLSDLLKYNNEEQKAKIVMNSKMHVVKMKWADPHNTIDTGLYLMRHLEMFMGDASASWKCQFLSTPQRQLWIMHVRYGAAMINWDGNKVKGNIVVQASRVYQDLSKKPEFDADNLLLN
ncbi:uncharacterized protein LOC131012319 [Salvia miltiorrhiza]|uniref:uncharacterized protein LOC131012319 n=1 Tax=Salvia miltiorrhiza TaxID=226208 RepID=UPI0025ACF834|nr:uncharacterized protein LOC131012319 [Salvia miltiorrhiza]